jgi:glutathione S-transferase
LYFRLTDREYETKAAYIPKSPNKRVPYVRGVGDGLLADTHEIISALEAAKPSLDEGLDDEMRSAGQDIEKRVQEGLYFACLYSRFVEPEGWVHQKPAVKAVVPWFLAPILVPVIRKGQIKACAANGFEDPKAGYARAEETAERVAKFLGDKPFLLGEEPRVADCAVWANTLHNAYTPSANPARAAVRSHANVMAYIQRVAARAQLELPTLPT